MPPNIKDEKISPYTSCLTSPSFFIFNYIFSFKIMSQLNKNSIRPQVIYLSGLQKWM